MATFNTSELASSSGRPLGAPGQNTRFVMFAGMCNVPWSLQGEPTKLEKPRGAARFVELARWCMHSATRGAGSDASGSIHDVSSQPPPLGVPREVQGRKRPASFPLGDS